TRPRPATTAAGTSPPTASPSTCARHTTIDPSPPPPVTHDLSRPLPHPDPDAMRQYGEQALDWVLHHLATLPHPPLAHPLRPPRGAAPRRARRGPPLGAPAAGSGPAVPGGPRRVRRQGGAERFPDEPPPFPRLHPGAAELPVGPRRPAVRRHQLLRRRLAGGVRADPGGAGRPRLVQGVPRLPGGGGPHPHQRRLGGPPPRPAG